MKPFTSKMFSSMTTRDVITLFHSPSSPASMRALTVLKQASAHAGETATEDQASDHSHQNKTQRSEFDLEVTEATPTSDQVRSILDYLGGGGASELVKGAGSVSDALAKLKSSPDAFQKPVIVDWNAGRAVVGDNESEILKLVNQLPK